MGDGQARSPKKGTGSEWGFGQVAKAKVSRGLTGPSTWLGWGGFSWRSVLSLVPGIWESPSIRDLPPGGGERERGGPSWPPGCDLTVPSLIMLHWL